MKKILVLLLIAIITCEAIEELPPIKHTLPYPFPYPYPQISEQMKQIIRKTAEILKSSGKSAAIAYCSRYLSIDLCGGLVALLPSLNYTIY